MLVLIGVLIAVWVLLIRRFGEGDVYAVIGPYACAVASTLVALRSKSIRSWLKPEPRSVLVGLCIGVVMTLLTYPVFELASSLVPDLRQHVQDLYVGARSTTLPKALGWVLAVILAEELLFRGVLPDILSNWFSDRVAYAASLIIYALAQLGTGSAIVLLMATVCGTIWTVQRRLMNSLLSPLIAHLIWTPTVILLYPVT